MLCTFFARVLDSKVIDNEADHNGPAGLVFEKTWCVLSLVIAGCFDAWDKDVNGKARSLW